MSPDEKTLVFVTEVIENIPKGWRAKGNIPGHRFKSPESGVCVGRTGKGICSLHEGRVYEKVAKLSSVRNLEKISVAGIS
jgi:hypothetical protein